MKTKHIIAVALTAMTIIISSNLSQAQIKIGVRGGLNASNISFDNLPERSEKYGYHLGMFLEVPVVPAFFSIQPEVSFSTKGTEYKYLNDRKTLTMNSVDLFLPVAFKLSTVDLTVGPFMSFLINKPVYTQYTDNSVIINGFKKVDAGLTAGLAFNISKFLLGVRYNQGLIDVSEDNLKNYIGSGKNAVGQVSLGYKF
jgi:hypothetical protein